ncbi:MAG TPA: hypothetical protein VGG75_33910 [Trebonia sp.]
MLDHAELGGRPVQRMQQPPAPAVATAQNSLDVTQEDLQIVRDHLASTHDPDVQALLRELISHLGKVTQITQDRGRSGGHTRDLGGHQYEINYSFPENGDPRDRISVLVHELTHVAVNEAYDSNMLNLPVPALSPEETAAVRSSVPSANHEEALQNARIAKGSPAVRKGYIDLVVRQAGTLLRDLPGSGLPPELQEKIRDKLANHTTMKPYHEYDAVLAHLLAWSDQYGADKSSDFYTHLTSLVRETVSWRQPGSLGPDIPPPASGSAPAGPVNSPASARRDGNRAQDRFARLMNKLAQR